MSNVLNTGRTFYVRTRQKATSGLKSEWSEPVKFMTATLSINKPSFVNGNMNVGAATTAANISAFQANGGQTLASLDYQVSRSSSFTSFTQNVSAQTSPVNYVVVNGITPDGVLYVRARHRSNLNVVSEWSDPVEVRGAPISIGGLRFVNTTQTAAYDYWYFEISGGEPNWSNLTFVEALWEFSESSNFTNPIVYHQDNGSTGPSGRNFLVHLSTRNFKINTVYYIRVKKRHRDSTGVIRESTYASTTSKIPLPIYGTFSLSSNTSVVYSSGGLSSGRVKFTVPRVTNDNDGWYERVNGVKQAIWEIYDGSTLVKTVTRTENPNLSWTLDEELGLPVTNENFSVSINTEKTYRVRVKLKLKTGAIFIAPDGLETEIAWSDYKSFTFSGIALPV